MTDIIMKHIDNSDSNDNMETFKVHKVFQPIFMALNFRCASVSFP